MNVILLPTPLLHLSVRHLLGRGYAVSNRGRRMVVEERRSNVVALRSMRASIVEAVFEFSKREQS